MKGKISQWIMIWLLPVILIGGLFFPLLGYLVVGMMVFFLVLSFFKPRFWCWNLCPRGSFLDIALSRVSANRPLPKIFLQARFRWLVFTLMMTFLIWRLTSAGGSFVAVGKIFVVMCVVTTVIAMLLGTITKHRAWCMICPMGLLQEKIGKSNKGGKK